MMGLRFILRAHHLSLMFVCIVQMSALTHVCEIRGQLANRSWFSPSTRRVLEIELRSSGLVASACTHCAI